MVQPKHPLSVRILESKITNSMKKSLKQGEYDGKGDPWEHVQLVNDRLSSFNTNDASKWKLYVLTLIGPTGCGSMVCPMEVSIL